MPKNLHIDGVVWKLPDLPSAEVLREQLKSAMKRGTYVEVSVEDERGWLTQLLVNGSEVGSAAVIEMPDTLGARPPT